VNEGTLFSILESSGSGKTTILKIITGLTSSDEGSIYLDGRNIIALKPEDRGIAYVFQAPLLFPHLTVKEVAYRILPLVLRLGKSKNQKSSKEFQSY